MNAQARPAEILFLEELRGARLPSAVAIGNTFDAVRSTSSVAAILWSVKLSLVVGVCYAAISGIPVYWIAKAGGDTAAALQRFSGYPINLLNIDTPAEIGTQTMHVKRKQQVQLSFGRA